MIQPDPMFMTPAECAAELRVTRMTIYRLIDHGDVEAIRTRGSIRIFTESWRKFLETSRVIPGELGDGDMPDC